jgi:hypothetical protein
MTSFLRSDRSQAVAIWLFAVAALVLAMVVVGGATRLTDSGLSITQWKPVTGALPPLNGADWQAAFADYKQIPQYAQLNAGMSLDQFKSIYWWEWSHRLLGRVVGLVFFVPFVWFAVRREIPRRLFLRLAGIFVLGGLQGAVGWWMVASGLSERVSVAPERLMLHLGLAFALLGALVWTAMDAWAGWARQTLPSPWGGGALLLTADDLCADPAGRAGRRQRRGPDLQRLAAVRRPAAARRLRRRELLGDGGPQPGRRAAASPALRLPADRRGDRHGGSRPGGRPIWRGTPSCWRVSGRRRRCDAGGAGDRHPDGPRADRPGDRPPAGRGPDACAWRSGFAWRVRRI